MLKLTAGREWLLLGLYSDPLNYRYWPIAAVVLAKVEAGEIKESTLKQWMHPFPSKP
jgi:hypothetical protein